MRDSTPGTRLRFQTLAAYTSVLSLLILTPLTPDAAHAGVTVKTTGKTQTATSITSGTVTICVDIGVPGPAGVGGPAPATFPTYEMDLYDDDVLVDDATATDSTAPPPACSAWVKKATKTYTCGTVAIWECCWTVPSVTVAASDAAGNPDPRIAVEITGPGSGGASGAVADIGAPGSVGVSLLNVDLGVTGPSNIANSTILFGEALAAFSRGHDEISGLGISSDLYFVSDPGTQTLSASVPYNEGQVFLLNTAGELWAEQAYGSDSGPGETVGTVRYLNVNRSEGLLSPPNDEMYVVFQGGSEILYTNTADVGTALPFLDLSFAGANVTGIAVEDLGARGVWEPGDRVLYALEGSSAIHQLEFGSPSTFLTVAGVVFDGNTTIAMDYLGDGSPDPELTVGNITALSASGTETPDTLDQFACDPIDCSPPSGVPALPNATYLLVALVMAMGVGLSFARSKKAA